jgi:D-alanyl-D-alanine carboxypeptidase
MNYGIIGVLIVIIVVWLLAKRRERKVNEDINLIEDFIEENPDRSAILIVQNDQVVMEHDADKVMPLAGIDQIIIAIEYAERSAQGQIDPKEIIYFDQLDDFYVPKTDGGAHMAWFKSISKRLVDGGIPLNEVVNGMLNYNSAANTEWLCEKLGLININQRLAELKLDTHTPINYTVSSLFIGHKLFPDLTGESLQESILSLSEMEYSSAAHSIHQKLLSEPDYKSTLPEVDFDIQKIWSDRQASSTPKVYLELMSKLNSKNFFIEDVQLILDDLLENLMKDASSKKWLKHAGEKRNSTAFALSKVMYATDLNGNKTEMALFFNNLTLQENSKLMRALRAFELRILTTTEDISK